MAKIDWSLAGPQRRPPTKAEMKLYRHWRKYLRDSKLDDVEQHRRATQQAESGNEPPQ